MRRKFSERYGFKQVEDAFQISNINDELKNGLWNSIKIYYIDPIKKQIGIDENYKIIDMKVFNSVLCSKVTHQKPFKI